MEKKVYVSCVTQQNKKPNKLAKFKGFVFKHLKTIKMPSQNNLNKLNNYKWGRYD